MSEVIVVIRAGSIGQAIARRVSAGKHVVLADLHRENADAAAEVMRDAGFDVSTAAVDVSSRESVHALAETATGSGDVTGVIHAAGVSPSQASPAAILAVDLYGTALVLEEAGNGTLPLERPARRDDLCQPPRAAAPPRRYRTPGLARLWSLAVLRRSAPLGCLQPGIVALALAGTMRCPVMPP